MYTRIRKAREDAGYTRERFAELLDVSVSYMAEVERGRTGVSVKMLVKICDVLGLSADYACLASSGARTTCGPSGLAASTAATCRCWTASSPSFWP